MTDGRVDTAACSGPAGAGRALGRYGAWKAITVMKVEMAIRTTVTPQDDANGGPAQETVRFGPAIAAERAPVAGGLVQPHGRDRSTATSGNSSGEP
jgi:hypothetical protein